LNEGFLYQRKPSSEKQSLKIKTLERESEIDIEFREENREKKKNTKENERT
jgi:hypothetical protein